MSYGGPRGVGVSDERGTPVVQVLSTPAAVAAIPRQIPPTPWCLHPTPYSLFPIPDSLFPVSYSLFRIPKNRNPQLSRRSRIPATPWRMNPKPLGALAPFFSLRFWPFCHERKPNQQFIRIGVFGFQGLGYPADPLVPSPEIPKPEL